jgi:hypothetical protein
MLPLSTYGGHSALVEMNMIVNGSSLPVAQMGPDFVLLNSLTEHPPAVATLVLKIDGTEERWNVHLPKGISPNTKHVAIAALR